MLKHGQKICIWGTPAGPAHSLTWVAGIKPITVKVKAKLLIDSLLTLCYNSGGYTHFLSIQ